MIRLVVLLVLVFGVPARGDSNPTVDRAAAIIDQVQAQRATGDFSLKARLFVTRDEVQPVTILVKNTAAETRAIYRGADWELLVIQPRATAPRFFLKGVGELTGDQRQGRIAGSAIAYADLGFGFLSWPDPTWLEEARIRGRNCDVIEVRSGDQQSARVKMWVDREYRAVLRAEMFDAEGMLVKRYALGSVLRVGEMYVPRGMEFHFVPPGQALPSQERSRLEIYQGEYDTQLPAAWFAEANHQ